jgi:hypothetical protein
MTKHDPLHLPEAAMFRRWIAPIGSAAKRHWENGQRCWLERTDNQTVVPEAAWLGWDGWVRTEEIQSQRTPR